MTPAPAAGLSGDDRKPGGAASDPTEPTAPRTTQQRPTGSASSDVPRIGRAPSLPHEAAWMRGWSILALATMAYLFAQIAMFGYGRDQGIYALVADIMLKGGMPYRDAWDFKPPGIFFIYAVARELFGRGEWAIRLLEILGLSGTVWAFTVLARRFFGDARIGLWGGALAVFVHAQLEFWHTAQPESFGGMLTAAALVCATWRPASPSRRARQRQQLQWAAAGALYGFTFLLKPPLAGGAVITAVFAGWAHYRDERDQEPRAVRSAATSWILAARHLGVALLIMGSAAIAIVALCLTWFAARGALHDLYETLFVFTPHYTKLSWQDASVPGMVYLAFEEWLVSFSSVHAVALLAAFALAPIAPREREGMWHLLLVIAVQLGGVAMQGKFFPYHYGASLMLGSLIAGLGAFKLWRFVSARGTAAQIAYVIALPLIAQARTATRDTQTDFLDRCRARQQQLLGLAHTTREELDAVLYSAADVSYGANRQVAAWLKYNLGAADTVFIWGFEPVIYGDSERRPASRFIYNVPQRVTWFKEGARTLLMRDLTAQPPRAIVVEHRDVFPAVTGDVIDSADTLREFPALAKLLRERYAVASSIEDFDIYLSR